MIGNILCRCVLGAVAGALSAFALSAGYPVAGAALIGLAVVVASWTEQLSEWVTDRFGRSEYPEEMAELSATIIHDLGERYLTVSRINHQLVSGMSELKELIAEAPMHEQTRRALMATLFTCGERVAAVLQESKSE